MNKNINLMCNNCGKQGHLFHQCKLPITSYGIILFRPSVRGIEYLMIRRKDSFGYIDFIRGKYSPYNIIQTQNIINEMSVEEKLRILKTSFDELWRKMWGYTSNIQYKNEENASSKKLEVIRTGVQLDDGLITLDDIVKKSNTKWIETEWEFPKGRRNNKEKDLECALREFEEETGILRNKIIVVENVMPFEETFIGTNHKSYKHKYFLAYMNDHDDCDDDDNDNVNNDDNNEHDNGIFGKKDNLSNFQVTEVSKIEWKTITECLESIRPYNLEKKKLIANINKVLEEYRLYS